MKRPLLLTLATVVLAVAPAAARMKPAAAAKAAADAAAVVASDRVFDPTSRVGAINPLSTEDDIVRLYGAANVTPSQDGKSLVLFAGGADELRIEFRTPHQCPERIAIVGANATWETPGGLKIGASVSDLETMNAGPFDVTGVNYQIPARVVSWKGGAFPPTMYVDLEPAGGIDRGTQKRLGSNKTFFDSSNPALRPFLVRRIVLEW